MRRLVGGKCPIARLLFGGYSGRSLQRRSSLGGQHLRPQSLPQLRLLRDGRRHSRRSHDALREEKKRMNLVDMPQSFAERTPERWIDRMDQREIKKFNTHTTIHNWLIVCMYYSTLLSCYGNDCVTTSARIDCLLWQAGRSMEASRATRTGWQSILVVRLH